MSLNHWIPSEDKVLEQLYKHYMDNRLSIFDGKFEKVFNRSSSAIRARVHTLKLHLKYPRKSFINNKILTQLLSGGGKCIDV